MATALAPKPKLPGVFDPNEFAATPPQTTPQVSTPMTPVQQQSPARPRMTQDQRRERNRAAGYGLDFGHGRGRGEVEEGDPFHAAAVLGDELNYNHFDALDPNTFYSWQGGNADAGGRLVFKDRSGREFAGTAAQREAALADMESWKEAYYEEIGQPVPPSAGGAGGGAAGAGGAGGGSGGVAGPSDRIRALIDGLLSGQDAPYDATAIRRLKGGAYDEAAGGVEAAKRDAALRNRRSGNLYGASGGSAAAEAERAGRSDYSRAANDIENQAVGANFSAKLQGLQSGLDLMQQEREERMAQARDATDRERIRKEYDGLINSTRMKIDAEAKNIQKQMEAERASGAAGRAFQREMRDLDWQQELDRRAYEEPFRIYGALGD